MVRKRDLDTKGPWSRSGFDRGLRSPFFLIETLSITGQNLKTVYERDICLAALLIDLNAISPGHAWLSS